MTATAAQDCELGFLRTLALKSLPRNRPGLRQLLSVLRVKISQTGQVSKAVLLIRKGTRNCRKLRPNGSNRIQRLTVADAEKARLDQYLPNLYATFVPSVL